MQPIDFAIVGLYVLATIAIGLMARRRAARSMDDYYLAGNSMPWYMLSLSNASDMFDISGTMWLVALCVVYGLKSIWIPWVWPAREVRGFCEPAEALQAGGTAADPRRNVTGGTAYPGTLVVRGKGAENRP